MQFRLFPLGISNGYNLQPIKQYKILLLFFEEGSWKQNWGSSGAYDCMNGKTYTAKLKFIRLNIHVVHIIIILTISCLQLFQPLHWLIIAYVGVLVWWDGKQQSVNLCILCVVYYLFSGQYLRLRPPTHATSIQVVPNIFFPYYLLHLRPMGYGQISKYLQSNRFLWLLKKNIGSVRFEKSVNRESTLVIHKAPLPLPR